MTTLQEFIEETDKAGFQWAADEMEMYDENPDLLMESGDQMFPNIDNIANDDSLPMIHFYIGVVFGVGWQKKHGKGTDNGD